MSYVQVSGARGGWALGAAGPTDDDVRRELYAAAVSEAVFNWQKQIDQALSGALSVASVVNRGLIFIPNAADARGFMLEAKRQLGLFLPAATNAIRDRSRDLGEVKDSIDGFLANLHEMFGLSIDVANTQSFSSVIKDLVPPKNPTKNVPWYVFAGVGLGALFVVGYFIRSIR